MKGIIVVLLLASSLARAELSIEAGPSNVSNQWSDSITVIVQERTYKWAFALAWVSPQSFNTCGRIDCQWELSSQLGVGAERLFKWKRLTLGVGPYWFRNVSRISSSHFNIRVGLELELTRRVSLKVSHFSNADASKEIEVCNAVTCVSNDHNLGQDAVLLVVSF